MQYRPKQDPERSRPGGSPCRRSPSPPDLPTARHRSPPVPDSPHFASPPALLRLPDGATIQLFTCHPADLHADEDLTLSFNLRGRGSASLEADLMDRVSTTTFSNNPGVKGIFDDTIENPLTAPSAVSYTIDGTFAPGAVGTDLRFFGCSLDLSTRTVRP